MFGGDGGRFQTKIQALWRQGNVVGGVSGMKELKNQVDKALRKGKLSQRLSEGQET